MKLVTSSANKKSNKVIQPYCKWEIVLVQTQTKWMLNHAEVWSICTISASHRRFCMIGISASIKCRMTRRAHTNSDLQIQVTKSDLQDQQLNKKLHSNKKNCGIYVKKRQKYYTPPRVFLPCRWNGRQDTVRQQQRLRWFRIHQLPNRLTSERSAGDERKLWPWGPSDSGGD